MNVSRLVLAGVIVASFAGSYAFGRRPAARGIGAPADARATNPAESASFKRIVSLAPSTTEVLFAVGAGARVVGVTRYCDHPPEARAKPKVGGYYDPNYEAIVALRPDVVVTLPEHEEIRKRLHILGVRTLQLDHRTAGGVLDSIARVGETCGAGSASRALLSDLRSRIGVVRAKVASRARPRVLVSIGRQASEGSIRRITACGAGSFYDDLLKIAGGDNAYAGEAGYPRVSTEGILAMDPDVIMDLVSNMKAGEDGAEILRAEWETIPSLSAVRTRRVTVLGGDHLTVPGPRFIQLLEALARAIHPEVSWDRP